MPTGVLLVGSVPLANAEEVFRTASAILGDRLRRIPDGETGARTNWIGWQAQGMANHPSLEPASEGGGAYARSARFKLREGVNDITFNDLGYSGAAKKSYATFARLKEQGVIPADVRFEVSLPTPLAPVVTFIAPDAQPTVEPAYETRLLEELDDICAAIPRDQLAIQWDVAVEFAVLEGIVGVQFEGVEEGIVERLTRIGNAVPEDVELGYHLCYGDAGHRHFVQPRDTSKLVTIANAISVNITRPIHWLHLPVPRDRDDDAYFAPLANLKLHPSTELYLGLVHFTDGVTGTRKRIDAAQKVVPSFGVATECGMGRRPPDTIPALLQIHAEVAGLLA